MTHPDAHGRAPQTRGRTIHWAHRYDVLTNVMLLGKERALRETTVEMAAVRPGEMVLDVGCGTGSLTLAAKQRVGATGEVVGLDAAPEMIEVARGKAAQSGSTIQFRVGLIEDLPFPAGRFDVVLSSLMIHHLPDDLKRVAFAEIRRVLKPGGRLFAVDFEPPAGRFARLLLGHVLSHDMIRMDVSEYVPMLEETGFERVVAGRTRYRHIAFVSGSRPGP